MALNIKNADADRLARELAAITGLSITDALMEAIQEKLERERGKRSGTRLARDIARIRERLVSLPVQVDETADEIIGYDEHGLLR
jgi:antitoxin VapB